MMHFQNFMRGMGRFSFYGTMKSDEGTDTDLIWPKYIIFAGFILNESYILQPVDAVWH